MKSAGFYKAVRFTVSMLAVSTAVAGCCSCPAPKVATAPVAAKEPDPVVRFGPENVSGDEVGTVNAFGELRGLKVGNTHVVGDSNFTQHTFIDQGYDSDVTLDPTGKFLAFASTRDSEH